MLSPADLPVENVLTVKARNQKLMMNLKAMPVFTSLPSVNETCPEAGMASVQGCALAAKGLATSKLFSSSGRNATIPKSSSVRCSSKFRSFNNKLGENQTSEESTASTLSSTDVRHFKNNGIDSFQKLTRKYTDASSVQYPTSKVLW